MFEIANFKKELTISEIIDINPSAPVITTCGRFINPAKASVS